MHSAGVQDRDGIRLVVARLAGRLPRLAGVLADAGYNGPAAAAVREALAVPLTLVHKDKTPGRTGFQVLPKRWIVERTFGWLGRCRRLSKDYEQNPASSEAFICLAMTRLMARRLAA